MPALFWLWYVATRFVPCAEDGCITSQMDTDHAPTQPKTFNISLCIVDFLMVLKGGFGFHTGDVKRRFGADTLVIFYKVCHPYGTPDDRQRK